MAVTPLWHNSSDFPSHKTMSWCLSPVIFGVSCLCVVSQKRFPVSLFCD
jgi:hypothetical protein